MRILIALSLLPAPLSAQALSQSDRALSVDLVSHISRDFMQRGLDAFAPLDRISGGPGEAKAAAWIADQLTRLGIPHQVHKLRLYLSWPDSASLTVGTRRMKAATPSFSTSTPRGGQDGVPVLFGRSGPPFTGGGGAEAVGDVR